MKQSERLQDLLSGLIVFLIALPLCLGVALASGAPIFSGVVAGIIGGIVVGAISRSHTSVSGPAAGLTAVVATQIEILGSFEAFLAATALAGAMQIVLAGIRAGQLAAFFPSSVVKGLLAAIGIILIMKQIPHLIGYDFDPEGDFAFSQPDQRNTFTEIVYALTHRFEATAATIGFSALAVLLVLERLGKTLKMYAPLIVVIAAGGVSYLLSLFLPEVGLEASHRVSIPVLGQEVALSQLWVSPRFGSTALTTLIVAALTIAIVASLETLINLEAVDKLDPQQRKSPPNRELFAQGCGNIIAGFLGGIPITSVIIRSSVNINAGATSKASAIFHGFFLLVAVLFVAPILNHIPLACLAAILILTGFKLASPRVFLSMKREGLRQLVPFTVTVVSIIFTDLLVGVLCGLVTSLFFILQSNARRPVRKTVERHLAGDIVRIELAQQVSFLNQATLRRTLSKVPAGATLVIDGRNTNYVDSDIVALLREFQEESAPHRNIRVDLIGLSAATQLISHQPKVSTHTTLEAQRNLSPQQILERMLEGNHRFRLGRALARNTSEHIEATSHSQHPVAVVLSCIDSRSPAELVFDVGLGDIFSVRVAGNVTSPRVVGSIEYACLVAGAKVIMALGHTGCGAIRSAVDLRAGAQMPEALATCTNLDEIVADIDRAIDACHFADFQGSYTKDPSLLADQVSQTNVRQSLADVLAMSPSIAGAVADGRILAVSAVYDIRSGRVEILEPHPFSTGPMPPSVDFPKEGTATLDA